MRRIILGLLFSSASLLSGRVAKAQSSEPRVLTLQEATEFALKNNVAIRNAQLDVLIQEAVNAQVTAGAYPGINGTGEFIKYIDPIKSFIPGDLFGAPGTFQAVQFTPNYSATLGVSGNQVLFDGTVLVALQARKTIIELVQQRGKLSEEEVKYNVRKAYYSLTIAYKQFDIVKRSLALARQAAYELGVLQETGYAEKIEIDRTNVSINNLKTDSLRIANALGVSEQLLKYQMGMNINQPVVLADTSVENHIAQASTLIPEEANYNARPAFRLLNTQLKLNEFNVKRYQYAALPTLSAFGNMGYNYATNNFNELFGSTYIWSSFVGLRLNVPIFNGFRQRNQVKEAKLNVLKTRNDIELMQQTIDFQTSTAKITLRNSLLQVENQQRNLELATSVVDLARIKYKEGVGSSIEVTQAQNDLLLTQNNYFNALLDVVNAEADLQRALGQL